MSTHHDQLIELVTAVLARADVPERDAAARAIVDAALADGASDADARAQAMADAHASGRPLAYLTGRVPFMGLSLLAAPGALVARQETELLGFTAVQILEGCETSEPRLVDMCCGSGNLVCGISSRIPRLRAWASDLTPDAVRVAADNVARLGLDARVTVRQGDLFAAFVDDALEGSVDAVVCNPPYISTGKLEKDRAVLMEHEPREAFDGGPYGVSIFQRVIRDARTFLKPGGTLLFEIGVGQDRQVTALFGRVGGYSAPTIVANESGEPRVMFARYAGTSR